MNHFAIEDRLDWRTWVTPKLLETKPVHRWYVFPHSFTDELVHTLIEEWALTPNDRLLDPFVGAGTTLLAAKEKGIPAVGYDLSPLAVLATRVKVACYDAERLRHEWASLWSLIERQQWTDSSKEYPDLVQKALPGKLLIVFHELNCAIAVLDASEAERDFFKLALLSTIREFSRAVPTGGWLRWLDRQQSADTIPQAFSKRVKSMIEDIAQDPTALGDNWRTQVADARTMPDLSPTYSALITSPPYPNRHDYTRVFGVELMFGFLNWDQTRQLRYQSLHSHPEAHPERPPATEYSCPSGLATTVSTLRNKNVDSRVIRMLEGYFLDLYLVLRDSRRVCKSDAKIALVVGNAQYSGVPVPVDELTAEIGEQAGLECEKLIVARYRGNSAQQMKEYGRRPSRETVVVFRRP